MEWNAPEGTPMLTNLCVDGPAVADSFPLKRLPDELLLHVVAQVPEVDLLNLSLAARHNGSMVQDAPHRYPTISYADDAMPRRIARLARALFSRADLARAVAQLTQRPIIHLVEIPFTTLSAADNPVLQDFFQHTRVYMGEIKIAALLLASVPNLKELDLQILFNSSLHELDSSRYGHACSVQCRLPDKTGSHPLDVAMNPGLGALRKLHLHARHISWDWLALPCMKAITLGLHCSVDWDTASAGVSRVEELVLDLTTNVFLNNDRRYKYLPKLFQRMPFLWSLIINIGNKCLAPGPNQIEGDILGDDVRGSMEILVETMAAVLQALEVLRIKKAGTDLDWFKYLEPVTSLVNFNQMKCLQIPIEGISEQSLVSRKRIGEILPDRLEQLRLSGLSVEAMKGLEGVSSEDASLAFPALFGW